MFPSKVSNDPKYQVTFAYNNYVILPLSNALVTLEAPLSEPCHPDVTFPDIDVVTGLYGLRFDKNSSSFDC
jgi:hypothetical protein